MLIINFKNIFMNNEPKKDTSGRGGKRAGAGRKTMKATEKKTAMYLSSEEKKIILEKRNNKE